MRQSSYIYVKLILVLYLSLAAIAQAATLIIDFELLMIFGILYRV